VAGAGGVTAVAGATATAGEQWCDHTAEFWRCSSQAQLCIHVLFQ
jgi:hypothetical protein